MMITDKNYKNLEVDSEIFQGSSRILLLGGVIAEKRIFFKN